MTCESVLPPIPEDHKALMRSLGIPDDPRELFTQEERDALDQHLALMAKQRRKAEVASRFIPMAVKHEQHRRRKRSK